MDSLINQARVRFSEAIQQVTEEDVGIRGRRIPPQRTRSFKGEKSKTQNWFQRQFSGTMSKDYDTDDVGDYSAAVAAAAYAISSLYDNITPLKKLPEFEMPDVTSTKIRGKMDDASIGMREPKRRSKSLSASNIFEPDVPESSSAKIDGRKEGTSTKMLEPARRSKSSSDDSSGSESSDEKVTSVRKFFGNSSGKAPPIKKKISFADDLMNPKEAKETEAGITTKPSWKKRASFTDDKPSLKKPPTFADNTLDSIEAQRPVTAGLKPGKGFPIETALRPPPSLAQQTPTRVQGSKADAWERAQMAKIKERYNTVRSTIDSWENKKREAAKRQKEKRERELEQKRARVLQHFRREMESIDAVAKGARAEAEKKKIREELSVKKKANRIRTTGKLPPTCFCF
ncbi:unnamed protein product [Rhodiola kirilowii]